MITPFVTILDRIHSIKPNSEVNSVLHIPFVPFLKTMAEDLDPEHRSIKEMYTFTFEKYQIWGASARMLSQIFRLLSKKNLVGLN
jgi:hypothetical protein